MSLPRWNRRTNAGFDEDFNYEDGPWSKYENIILLFLILFIYFFSKLLIYLFFRVLMMQFFFFFKAINIFCSDGKS